MTTYTQLEQNGCAGHVSCRAVYLLPVLKLHYTVRFCSPYNLLKYIFSLLSIYCVLSNPV